MGVSPTSWVMSSATRSRVPSIVFILTVQSTGGEMEASTAGAGAGSWAAGSGLQAFLQPFRFSFCRLPTTCFLSGAPALPGKACSSFCKKTMQVCERQLLASPGGSRSPVRRALWPLLTWLRSGLLFGALLAGVVAAAGADRELVVA